MNTVGESISKTSAFGCCYGLGPLAWSYQISAQVIGATLEQQDKTHGSLSWKSCRRGMFLNATFQSSFGLLGRTMNIEDALRDAIFLIHDALFSRMTKL